MLSEKSFSYRNQWWEIDQKGAGEYFVGRWKYFTHSVETTVYLIVTTQS